MNLQRTTEMRDLGVTFDSILSFHPHINNLVASSLKLLGFIVRTCRCLSNPVALRTLYIALVRSKLEYCSLIWSPYYAYQKLNLENVQRKLAKHLFYLSTGTCPFRGFDHKDVLNSCSLDTLECRYKMSAIKFLYKVL